MSRSVAKFELYVVSLWLLFLLIIVVTVEIPVCFGAGCSFVGFAALIDDNWIPLGAAAFLFVGFIFYLRFGHRISGSTSIPVEITEVRDVNYEHLTFLTTYIIPLISFNLTKLRYVAALAILLVIIGLIYVRTDKFYANPTLALLGFHLYEATVTRRTGTQVRVVLVTRDKLKDGNMIQFLELDERVFFARKRK